MRSDLPCFPPRGSTAKPPIRKRIGVSAVVPLAAAILVFFSLRAMTRGAARQAPSLPQVPRIVRLIKSTPYAYALMRTRLKIQQDAGSPNFAFSSCAENRIVGNRPNIPSAEARDPAISPAMAQYATVARAAFFRADRNALRYAGAAGNVRRYFFYDRRLVSIVLVAAGTAGAAGRPGPEFPDWLASRVTQSIRAWISSAHPQIPPNLATGAGLLPSPGRWGSVVVLRHPWQIDFYGPKRRINVRLRFGRWKRGAAMPWLRSFYARRVGKSHGVPVETSIAVDAGRLAVPMPIHLTAKGLKKLGFTVVYLTAKTPAPAINPLTPTDEAKIKIMRRRFEKWAGVWSRLHPGPQIKAKKADGHK